MCFSKGNMANKNAHDGMKAVLMLIFNNLPEIIHRVKTLGLVVLIKRPESEAAADWGNISKRCHVVHFKRKIPNFSPKFIPKLVDLLEADDHFRFNLKSRTCSITNPKYFRFWFHALKWKKVLKIHERAPVSDVSIITFVQAFLREPSWIPSRLKSEELLEFSWRPWTFVTSVSGSCSVPLY